MSLSVLTIVKNRPGHLAELIEGLRRSAVAPCELIIVDMGSDPPVAAAEAPFAIHIISLAGDGLPLAAARNAAARAAISDRLLFLDVDCIPMRDLVGEMHRRLCEHDALICAEAFYLGPSQASGSWTEQALRRSAMPHPVRDFPTEGIRSEANAGLFWSLIFGIGRDRFFALDGFDEAFTGYGAEDTDFGFRAQRACVPLLFMGGSGAFHQYHEVLDPPLQHLDEIVRNARVFHDRWGVWPMRGWLEAFAKLGLIQISEGTIVLLRSADASELASARLCAPIGR